MDTNAIIKTRLETVLPLLNERQRRIYLSAEAQSIGRGGKSLIAQLSSTTRRTISKGETESFFTEEYLSKNRIRKMGGGRKKIVEYHPEMLHAIEKIISVDTPNNPLIWTCKSTRKIAADLLVMGYKVSHEMVRQCLIKLGYRLHPNIKTKGSRNSFDRNAQFRHINETAKEFAETKDPVIFVECRKKEHADEYKDYIQEWNRAENPTEDSFYDTFDTTKNISIPNSASVIQKKRLWVNVGISCDTTSFAVSTIRDWWEQEGKILFPSSNRLYINADGAESNDPKFYLWKSEIQHFSNLSGLNIRVSHFPPGTSKWNKTEHRLFAYILKNWRANPPTSFLVIMNLIGSTNTTTDLKTKTNPNKNIYVKGKKEKEPENQKLNIVKSNFHGEWNYTISSNL